MLPGGPMRTSLRLVLLAAIAAAGAFGCSDPSHDAASGEEGANTENFTDVNQSDVKRQSIGNCWLYATASWSESLNKSATPNDPIPNFSESYWTYWHWFEQIANG